jgi:flagellar basal body-associated protein FliL
MAETENAPDSPPKKKFPKTIAIVAAIAVVQGAGFFAIFKFVGGGPKPAHGEENHAVESAPAAPVEEGVAEVLLLKSFKVPNDKSGRMFIVDIDISVVVAAGHKDKMKQIAEERAGEIGDRVARIVRWATPEMMAQDDLRILRSQLAEGLAEVIEDKQLVQRVLIPRFVPIPS